MVKKNKKVPELTFADIEKCLRQGAKSANELDKTLKRVFMLTPTQLSARLG
jgi:hypothetical protein